MALELSRNELILLHCPRDGDDPYDLLSGADPIGFTRHVAQLVYLGLVEQTGRRLALTLEGLRELDEPGHSGPMPLEDYDL